MKCWKCGQENVEGTTQCVYCGVSLNRTEPTTEIGAAMRQLYDLYGAERILTDLRILANGIGDLVEDSGKIKRQLTAAADTHVGKLYLNQIRNAGGPDAEFRRKAARLLSEDAELSDKAVAGLMGYFDEMIGWPEAEKSKPESAPAAVPERTEPREIPVPKPQPAPAFDEPEPKKKPAWVFILTGILVVAAIVAGLFLAGVIGKEKTESFIISEDGFSGTVTVQATVNQDKVIQELTIETQDEVNGQKASDPEFAKQFIGKTGPFNYGENGIDSISGATITSRAVLNAINQIYGIKVTATPTPVITETPTQEPTPVVTETPIQEPTPTPTLEPGEDLTIPWDTTDQFGRTIKSVNFREDMSRKAKIFNALKKDTVVYIIANMINDSDEEWTHVLVNGKTGYIMKEYLELLPSWYNQYLTDTLETMPPKYNHTPAPRITASPEVSTPTPDARPTPTPYISETILGYYYKYEYDADGNVVNQWHCMATPTCTPTTDPEEDLTIPLYTALNRFAVVNKGANLRKAMTTSADKIGTVAENQIVYLYENKINSQGQEWTYLLADGKEGYVMTQYLTLLPSWYNEYLEKVKGPMPKYTAQPTEEPTATPTPTPKVLQYGFTESEEVRAVQQRLKDLGYYYGVADGDFDALTKYAVIEFQWANDLSPDGMVGEKTLMVLNSKNAVSFEEAHATPTPTIEITPEPTPTPTPVSQELNSDGTIAREYKYDSNGNKIKMISYNNGSPYLTYYYDASGNTTKVDYMDGSVTEYQYDSDNKKVQERRYNHGILMNRTTYDSNGSILKDEQFKGNGDPDNIITYQYDAAGRKIKHEYYNCDKKKVTVYSEYKYNSKGTLVEEWQYDENGLFCITEYDENGKALRNRMFKNGKEV